MQLPNYNIFNNIYYHQTDSTAEIMYNTQALASKCCFPMYSCAFR